MENSEYFCYFQHPVAVKVLERSSYDDPPVAVYPLALVFEAVDQSLARRTVPTAISRLIAEYSMEHDRWFYKEALYKHGEATTTVWSEYSLCPARFQMLECLVAPGICEQEFARLRLYVRARGAVYIGLREHNERQYCRNSLAFQLPDALVSGSTGGGRVSSRFGWFEKEEGIVEVMAMPSRGVVRWWTPGLYFEVPFLFDENRRYQFYVCANNGATAEILSLTGERPGVETRNAAKVHCVKNTCDDKSNK